MKYRKLFYGLALLGASLSLTGCADEDITDGISDDGKSISYGVSLVGNHTRALGLTSTNYIDNLPNMQVFAYYHPNANGFGVTHGTQ